MAEGSTPTGNRDAPAAPGDIQHILGHTDDAKLLDIMPLHPTVLDVEEAWLAGDSDVYGAGRPLKTVAGAIVAILTADEEEEPPRAT